MTNLELTSVMASSVLLLTGCADTNMRTVGPSNATQPTTEQAFTAGVRIVTGYGPTNLLGEKIVALQNSRVANVFGSAETNTDGSVNVICAKGPQGTNGSSTEKTIWQYKPIPPYTALTGLGGRTNDKDIPIAGFCANNDRAGLDNAVARYLKSTQ